MRYKARNYLITNIVTMAQVDCMMAVQAENMMNQDNVTTPDSAHATLLCESWSVLPVIKWVRM